jgi:hypothetical protein
MDKTIDELAADDAAARWPGHLSMRQNPGCSLSFCMLTAGGIERPQKKAWLDLPAGSIGK